MSPASASADKTERLLNLILALKSARRPVSKQKIRESLPAYAAATSDEAFDRMFERDKDELREMGIPITTTVLDVLFDDEVGYRIDASETTLPAISFEPDEVAALALAARAWSTASISGAASAGLRKLRLSGVEIDESVAAGAEPRIRTKEPAFEAVHAAVSALQPITFDYRKNDGELTTRHVQPWALKNWHGRWYLTGFDLDRGDERAFRLSRFEGAVRASGRAGVVRGARPTTCPRWPSRRSCPSPRARPSSGCATAAATRCAATPSARPSSTSGGPRSRCPTAAARPSATSSPSARTPSPCRRPSSSTASGRRCRPWPRRTGSPAAARRRPSAAIGGPGMSALDDGRRAGRPRRRRSASADCSTWCRGCSSTAACRSPRPRASSGSTRTRSSRTSSCSSSAARPATATPSSSTPSGRAATSTSTTPTTSRPRCA